MKYLQVKSWEDFQHYKDRTPPWIKLYNHLLDDFEFSCLPDASKAHLLSIWLLASRTNNKIPNNARWIGNKINATEEVDLNLLLESGFIELIPNENNELHKAEHDASILLHKAEYDACLEREGKREKRRVDSLDYEKIKDIFNSTLTKAPSISKLTDKRKRLVKKLFTDFDLDYEKFGNYLRFLNEHPEAQWMFQKRPKNDGSGQNWNPQTFEYFVGEKCFLNAKENLQ